MALPFLCALLTLPACTNAEKGRIDASRKAYLLELPETLTIEALRARSYESEIAVEAFSTDNCIGDADVVSLPDATGTYKSYMASFSSDGLRQYARITVPDGPAPDAGFPYVLFLHGHIGKEKAPGYSIGCNPENLYYSELTDAFARAGFAVLAPGYRGHATVNGIPAEGLEYLEAFDQGAGLSTQFYAIDALNFAAGRHDIDGRKFPEQLFDLDPNQFFLVGHSQGGDAGLTYLATVGAGRHEDLQPAHAALWSGTFLPRLRALEEMMPVGLTADAFLSGDGTWTGTAQGKDGSTNPNFIFGYPPDWIEEPDPTNWTWQKESWPELTVSAAIETATSKMYSELADHVGGLEGMTYKIRDQKPSKRRVEHDARVAQFFPQIGGYNFPTYLQDPVSLHVPEKDYYSQISWNEDLCDRINQTGGACDITIYPHNNHSMRASPHLWFSPEGTPDGYPIMMENLVAQFSKPTSMKSENTP